MKSITLETPWKRLTVLNDPMNTLEHEQENRERISKEQWSDTPVFIDIGAHQGVWTAFLAHLAGPKGMVYAFEPHPDNVGLLFMNFKFRGDNEAPVILMPCAVGNKDAIDNLNCWNYAEDVFATTGKHQFIKGPEEPHYYVPVVVRKLDTILLPTVDFIKIDAEHWEFEVLKGAEYLIYRDRPRMLIEIHDSRLGDQIRPWLEERGYRIEPWRHFFKHDNHFITYFFARPKNGGEN